MRQVSKKEMLELIASSDYPMLLTDGEILVQFIGANSPKSGYILVEGCCFYTPKLFRTVFDFYDSEFDGDFEGEEVDIDQTHFSYEKIEPGFYVVKDGLYVNGYFHKTDDADFIINTWYGGQDLIKNQLEKLALSWVKAANPDGSKKI